MFMSIQCTFIGSGNLATRLALRMFEKGIAIKQVYSRNLDNAEALAKQIKAEGVSDPAKVNKQGIDLFIVALADKAYDEVLPYIDFGDKIVAHTAGSVPMKKLAESANTIGVFYPLQTFSKGRMVDFNEIPLCLEAESDEVLRFLEKVANIITDDVRVVSSEDRKQLHLAAVFCCNFVNHLYALCESIVNKADLNFDILRPLIKETASKIETLSPKEAQTGPAIRYDKNIINNHLDLLDEDENLKNVYELLTSSIFKLHNQ
ncbi:DUF2520 domain-containing protein [Puteibacter caeruleilacunae]|nr:DUF2520 domain-containing protein [Puteibacter caeruleilacunae]